MTTGQNYLRELRQNWQALMAACLGLVAGTMINYLGNNFSPHLIEAFGWSRAQFALIGLTVVIAAIALPIAGRLADHFGLRRIATVGVVGLPLVFFGMAVQPGSFAIYFLLSLLQLLIVSSLVGIVVYNRLIVREFTAARGLALGIASCAPAVAAAIGSPFLSAFIDAQGWRSGYHLLAAITAIVGAFALWSIPRDFDDRTPRGLPAPAARRDYAELLRDRAFAIIFGAMILCNVHFTIQTTQLKLIVEERGIGSQTGATMISAFAVGVIFGRILCGIALDHFSARIISSLCFLVPSMGLMMLASGTTSVPLIGLAIMGLGFSLGAEGDIASYLAIRYFREELFSTVLGLFAAAMACSALLGALLLSWTVGQTGGYGLFLGIAATSMFLGSLAFLFLGKPVSKAEEPVEAALEAQLVREIG